MRLISVTNKKTQLHKSHADLSVLCAHQHNQKRAVSCDISFCQSAAAANCFGQIYKTDILEIWHTKKSSDGTGELN